MTKITIPYAPPDLGPNSDFQTKIFRKNRETVLSELRRLSGIPEIASTLNQDTVYKIVCSPEGGKLYTDTAGNLKGVFYKDGKIVQHAKLRVVGRSFFQVCYGSRLSNPSYKYSHTTESCRARGTQDNRRSSR